MEDEISALNQIESLSFDYKLDNINGNCAYCSSCYNNGNHLKNPFSFQLLCHRLVKNIDYTHSTIVINGTHLKEKRCEDVIYWMNNYVNNMNDKKDKNEISNIINELKKIWDEVNRKLQSNGADPSHICDTSKINTIIFDELKRKKTMSDYCQNFDTLHTKLTVPNKANCRIYYDYFTKTKEAYKNVFEECYKSGASTDNCPYLCKDKKNDPDIILKDLKCTNIPVPEIPKKIITQEECNAETDRLKSDLEKALLAANNPAFNFSDPRAVLLILFTFWGIFLTFFFLYKLTPFSSWIRNKLLEKKLVRDDFDEQVEDESIYDYSNTVNSNMQNVGYNMSYNSEWSPSL